MTNETLITQEGLQKLKDELNELKSVRRKIGRAHV